MTNLQCLRARLADAAGSIAAAVEAVNTLECIAPGRRSTKAAVGRETANEDA
jgi:hypothetical protein